MKIAVLAIRHAEVLRTCQRLLADLEIPCSVVHDATALRHTLQRQCPDIVIAQAYLEAEPVCELIPQWKAIRWLVLMNHLETWGGARLLSTLAPRVSVLTAHPATYDLMEAVRAAIDDHDAWFVQMKNAFERAWTKSLEAFPGTFGLDVTDETHRAAQAEWLKMHFEPEFPAPCQAVSNLAILCRIVRLRQTGMLEFLRDDACLRLSWWQGHLCGVQTNIRQLDRPWFEQTVQHDEDMAHTPAGEKTGDGTVPGEHGWFVATLSEVSLWQKGDVFWKAAPVAKTENMITPEAWNRLANQIVFRLSSREILDTVRALLPFSFKLRTSMDDVLPLFSYTGTRAVVERLQKSDTLSELLVYLPQGYPIHQTIYLLLAQSCLDIDMI